MRIGCKCYVYFTSGQGRNLRGLSIDPVLGVVEGYSRMEARESRCFMKFHCFYGSARSNFTFMQFARLRWQSLASRLLTTQEQFLLQVISHNYDFLYSKLITNIKQAVPHKDNP